MALWRSDDAALPLAALPRISCVHPARWSRTWQVIGPLFSIDGERLTQKRVLLERERAKKISATRKSVGQLGGLASGRSPIMTRGYVDNKPATKPLENNGSGQAIGQHSHSEKEKKKKGEGSPRPRDGEASPSPKRGKQEKGGNLEALNALLDKKEKGWRQ
jgi:uncharacterized protein YdaU (DUF1376 family)